MDNTQQCVCYEGGYFTLATASSQKLQVLRQGDTLNVFEYGRFQPVQVCSGGYGGWYYLTADGRRSRLAVGMQAQNYRAGCSSI